MTDAGKESRLTWGETSDGYVIRVDGRGTMRESPTVNELGVSCLDHDSNARLTVDLTGCDYLDSSFLGCLVMLSKHGRCAGQNRLTIAAPAERRKALLSATGLDRFFDQTDVAPEPLEKPLAISPSRVDARTLGHHIMQCHQELARMKGPNRQAFARVAKRLDSEQNGE